MDFSLYLKQLEESDKDEDTEKNEGNKDQDNEEEAAALNSKATVRPPKLIFIPCGQLMNPTGLRNNWKELQSLLQEAKGSDKV